MFKTVDFSALPVWSWFLICLGVLDSSGPPCCNCCFAGSRRNAQVKLALSSDMRLQSKSYSFRFFQRYLYLLNKSKLPLDVDILAINYDMLSYSDRSKEHDKSVHNSLFASGSLLRVLPNVKDLHLIVVESM